MVRTGPGPFAALESYKSTIRSALWREGSGLTFSGARVSSRLDMSESDARLVALARAGDTDAFEALVRRHLRAAYAVALSVLGDVADAEDVCQDAFLVALERLEDCRRPERFAAWLLQIVRNRARNAIRYAGVRQALPLEAIHGVAGGQSPDREAIRARVRDRLLDALQELPEIQRQVLMLHDLEGWRHREIAEALEIPEGTARAHLSQARRAMRRLLGAEFMEEEA